MEELWRVRETICRNQAKEIERLQAELRMWRQAYDVLHREMVEEMGDADHLDLQEEVLE